MVDARAKGLGSEKAFGTGRDTSRAGFEHLFHFVAPTPETSSGAT